MPGPTPSDTANSFAGPFGGSFNATFTDFGAVIPDMIYYLDETLVFWMQCTDPATGAASDATGTPTYKVYRNGSDTAVSSGSLAKQDDANTTGWYKGSLTLATGTYTVDTIYTVVGFATVAGVTQEGPLAQFVVRAAPATSAQATTILANIAALPTAAATAAAVWANATGAKLVKLFLNRYVQSGNVITTYEDDSTTPAFTQGYSVTSTGFDRSKAT